MTREQTPTDELTGLPLLLVPQEGVLPLLRSSSLNTGRLADWNHVYHPRKIPELQSRDGKAVRDCRGQFVMRSDHDEYHAGYDGPPLPTTTAERFRAVVLSAAGYVPPQAIDVRGDSATIVSLDETQVRRLHTSGEVRLMQHRTVHDFLVRTVLAQRDYSHIKPKTIDDFLVVTLNPESDYERARKEYLSHLLLSLVIDPVVSPIHTAYKLGLETNRLHKNVPGNTRDFVHSQIVGNQGWRRRHTIRRIGEMLFDNLLSYREDSLSMA